MSWVCKLERTRRKRRSELIHERKEWSERRIAEVCRAVSNLDEVTDNENLCIYVTGSFGRLEASQYSDLDLFFIEEDDQDNARMSRLDKTLMFASVIKQCRLMEFPEFSDDGEYLQVHNLHNMRASLGGRSDDYENLFTARQLLLLESAPIYNKSLYEKVLHQIARSYFRDFMDHEDDFQPTFLVNDILRFWKTLCLNYEHGRNDNTGDEIDAQKSQLKNLKLKFSRMLTCFSLVIALIAVREPIEPEQCVALMHKRPLERLKNVATNINRVDLWDSLCSDYSWFLRQTGRNAEDVLDWVADDAARNDALCRARRFGNTLYELLVVVAKPETLRYLVI